jgi:hypothetical protein
MREYWWAGSSREELLDVPFRDLELSIEGTWLSVCIKRLRDELEMAGFTRFKPHFYLADEWCCADGIPGVGIPFYLAHPRLMRLEETLMFEVEGGTRRACMRLLRHETAHALQHAYDLQRRRRWQRLFGRASDPYPEFYRPNPMSKGFVQHLDGWYAQAHPVEDFAETFAIWLPPRSSWRTDYEGWGAFDKLEYLDELVADVGDTPMKVRSRARPYAVSSLRHTLRLHYSHRQSHYSPGFSQEYDRDLFRVFSDSGRFRKRETAASFLHRHRRALREQVAEFTGEYVFTVDQVLKDIIGRCRELRLRLCKSERQTRVEVALMLSVHTVHTLHRRNEWRPL